MQFLGVVSHDVVPTLLAAADVAVAPSVHDDAGNVDGLPNTVMEIMASGTPLVATPAGGIGAVATDRVTARLVAERDVRALASAIDELLRDRSAATLMGRQARELVCRHHSWARVAEDFEAVYRTMLITDRVTDRHRVSARARSSSGCHSPTARSAPRCPRKSACSGR